MSGLSKWVVLPLTCSAALGCSDETHLRANAAVGLGITAPQALLDDLDHATLFVVDATGGRTCSASSGLVSSSGGTTGLVPADLPHDTIAQASLARTSPDGSPCPANGVFCSGDIILPIDASRQLVFQVVGYKNDAAYGVGCATVAIVTDPLQVSISMHRYVPTAVCGDGILAVGEQCEGSGGPPAADDPICDTTCHTKEVLLSSDNAGPGGKTITNAPPQSKKGVSVAWSKAPSATNPNPFHAVFQDTNFGTQGTGPEINYRQMSQDLLRIASPALLGAQVRLPYKGGTTPGFDQRPRTQGAPAIGVLDDGSFIVAYEDDRSSTTGQTNISMTHVSADAQPDDDTVYINSLGLNECTSPAVAGGPQTRALIVWTDNASKRVRGRIWSPSSGWVTGSELSLSTQQAAFPRVAGFDNGWVVVWQGASTSDANDILARVIDASGNGAAPFVVNDLAAGVQDQPTVAALPSGEFVVAWRDGSNVMMQRFDASGGRVAGDQSSPVNDAGGAGERPAAAGSGLANGFFALAWQAGTEIRARLVDKSAGFRANSVDGQESSFPVSDPSVSGQRSAPAVTIGGAGHIVFAWQDDSTSHPGIYARRFPLPVD